MDAWNCRPWRRLLRLGAVCVGRPPRGWQQRGISIREATAMSGSWKAGGLWAAMVGCGALLPLGLLPAICDGQEADRFPPRLPRGQQVAVEQGDDLLRRPATLRPGVAIAKTPPRVEFQYFPGQDYPGKPWSAWGDSLAVEGKYYASIGDHLAPRGNAFVHEYDDATSTLRRLVDVRGVLKLPEGHYTPGKIHGRLDLGRDGWLYFATHRGSPRATTDAYHFRGDWIVRHHPERGQTEIVAHGPVPKHSIPTSVLDPQRMIFYGGTAPGEARQRDIHFFAFDVEAGKLLYSGPGGPPRAMILAASTGRVYFTAGSEDGPLARFDPAAPAAPTPLAGRIGIRAASGETAAGKVYTVSHGGRLGEAELFAFDTKTETVESLGPAAVGTQQYIASLDVDGSGRYLYYVPGAHGGSDRDGAAVVQFDLKRRQKKVIAFLHPVFAERYGCTLKGTYSTALSPDGARLYITWNASRGGRAWDCCALTVLDIPASERAGE
jgi:hypothetical protein